MRRALVFLLLLAPAPILAQEPAKVRTTQPAVPAQAPLPKQSFVFRDTLTVRLLNAGSEDDVLRIVYDLRDRELRLLRELETTSEVDVQARRRLIEALQGVSREAFTAMSVIESRCLNTRDELPAGYLGVNLTTTMAMQGQRVTTQGTTVTSVEPGSPAESAGLARGDVLVSIAGRDAREQLPELADVLQPGRRVMVRVVRDGTPHEIAVTVAPRPRTFESSCASYERALRPLRLGAVGHIIIADTLSASGNGGNFVVRTFPRVPLVATTPPTPTTPSAGATPPTPAVPATAPAPPTQITLFGTSPSVRGSLGYFGGAQFRPLDDDWRNVLGVRAGVQGVLVNEVAPGSAAAQSGLKVGDVIVEVAGNTATSPYVVVRLLGVTEGNQAALEIIRARERRTVTLRWGERTP